MALLDDPKWLCPQCTYSNWLSSPHCILCRCQKPPEIIPKTSSIRSRAQNQATSGRARPPHNRYPSGEASCSPHIILEDSAAAWCSSPMACGSDKWACHSCTYANWPNASRCVMCKVPRVQGDGPRSEQQGHGYGSNAGAVGGRDAPPHTSLQPQVKGAKKQCRTVDNTPHLKWKCSRCTYDNWASATKCAMCQAPKLRTPSPPLVEHHHSLDRPAMKLESSLHGDTPPTIHQRNANASPGLICVQSPTSSNRHTVVAIDGADHGAHKPSSNEIHQIRNRLSSDDWLFLNACVGVVNNDYVPVKKYLGNGLGDKSRQLTRDECVVLNNPSKFSVGSTLVQLAVR